MTEIHAVLVDAGGVFFIPHADHIAEALQKIGLEIDPLAVERAHYCGIVAVDTEVGTREDPRGYLRAYVAALGVPTERNADAAAELLALWEAREANLWRQAVRGAVDGLRAVAAAGVQIAIVSNSDGTVEEQLLAHGVCQVGAGGGVPVASVVDSFVVGCAKPDRRIFDHALTCLGVAPANAIHVGDSVRYDVEGARAAGVFPVHLDPYGLCVATDHDHVRELGGVLRWVNK